MHEERKKPAVNLLPTRWPITLNTFLVFRRIPEPYMNAYKCKYALRVQYLLCAGRTDRKIIIIKNIMCVTA